MATLGQILSETGYGMPRAQDLARRNMEEQEAQYRLDQSARINEQNQLALANLRRQEEARRLMAQGPTTLPSANLPTAPALPTGFAGYPNLASGTKQAVAPAPLPAAGAPAAVAPQLSPLEEFRRTERAFRSGEAGLATPPSAPVSPYAAPAVAPSAVRTMPGYIPGAVPVPVPPRADQSRAGQIIGGIAAQSNLERELAKITTKLDRGDYGPMPNILGKLKGFFTDVPKEAQDRARGVRALEWFQSPVAKEYFRQNPDLVGPASVDPIGFAERFIAEGNVPAAKPTAAPTAAPAVPTQPTKRAQAYDSKVTPYDTVIQTSAERYNIDPVVFKRLIGTESSFDPAAVSPRGEKFGLGIAQIAASHKLTREQMLDPNTAIPFAASLFAQYLNQNNGDYEKALLQYKGATSAKGKADMASAVNTVLSGSAVAAPGAAAAPAGPAVQILTPTAGVAEKAPTKPTVFYSANRDAIPADRKILDEDYGRMRGLIQTTINNQQQVDKQAYDSTRAALAQQFTAFMQAGMPSEAQRIRAEVVKLDSDFGTQMNTANTDTQAKLIELDTRYRTGRLMVDGMDAVTRLEYGNDPRALEQVLSFHTGQPVAFQPVADGTYIMSINGNPRGTYTRAQVGDMAKEYFDVEYRKAKAASQAELAKLEAKSRADQALELVKANAKMIGDAAIAMMNANAKMREVSVEGRKIKLTPTGDGSGKAYVYSEDGTNLGVLDPRSGQMQDLNGVSIPLPPIVVAAQR